MVTGVVGPCVGNIGPIPRLGFSGLCLQAGPLAIRQADYASVFPAGLSAAASWDIGLIHQRGLDLGSEFKGKGANIALGYDVRPRLRVFTDTIPAPWLAHLADLL